MALLATQDIDLDGLQPAYAAAAASDTFVPDADTFIHVKNAGGSSDTVGIATPGTLPGGGGILAIGDAGGSVPATTGDRMFGPFPYELFADPATGLATITHSFTTSVTVAVLRARRPG